MGHEARVIERFQLGFLLTLAARVPGGWVVKGGVNLRLFHGSPRASKDIDFDGYVPLDGLASRVNAVLSGPALSMDLDRAQLRLVDLHPAKMTPTTLRWKPELQDQHRRTFSTKLEFSSRLLLEPQSAVDWMLAHHRQGIVGAQLRNRHSMAVAPSAPHYDAAAAYEQKIAALALRGDTKSRDVFDMNWLLAYDAASCSTAPGRHAAEAAERASELGYEQFTTEVVPFLDEGDVDVYGNRGAWTQMQTRVLEALLGHAPWPPSTDDGKVRG